VLKIWIIFKAIPFKLQITGNWLLNIHHIRSWKKQKTSWAWFSGKKVCHNQSTNQSTNWLVGQSIDQSINFMAIPLHLHIYCWGLECLTINSNSPVYLREVMLNPLVLELNAQCTLQKQGFKLPIHYFACYWLLDSMLVWFSWHCTAAKTIAICWSHRVNYAQKQTSSPFYLLLSKHETILVAVNIYNAMTKAIVQNMFDLCYTVTADSPRLHG